MAIFYLNESHSLYETLLCDLRRENCITHESSALIQLLMLFGKLFQEQPSLAFQFILAPLAIFLAFLVVCIRVAARLSLLLLLLNILVLAHILHIRRWLQSTPAIRYANQMNKKLSAYRTAPVLFLFVLLLLVLLSRHGWQRVLAFALDHHGHVLLRPGARPRFRSRLRSKHCRYMKKNEWWEIFR